MKNKAILGAIILIILIGGFFLFSKPKDAVAPLTQEIAPREKTAQDTIPLTAPAPKQHTVVYTADGFSPAVLNITAGDTVVFTNKSGGNFWPASNEHPTHAAYPEFDAKTEITDRKTYEFTFTKAGAWGYHNHLNPKMMGVVVVK